MTINQSVNPPIHVNSLAAAITAKEAAEVVRTPATRRADLNMEIDTLSERSEEEDQAEERQRRPQRGRKLSGKKRSISR